MKILIITEIDDNHWWKEFNDLHDRLKGRKAKTVPIPEEMKPVIDRKCKQDEPLYQEGWNDCRRDILGD